MTMRCTAIVIALALFVVVDAQPEQCLLQAKSSLAKSRTSITKDELISAEKLFTSGEADHGDVGGDRMSLLRHNYAPIYAKYMTSFLKTGDVPIVAEVGILKGTGLAMWSRLFPSSHVFGFDQNTSSYHNNVEHMRSLGFEDGSVKVTAMDQMKDNRKLLQSVLGELRPNIVVDDGFHIPEAGEKTFLSMKPFLAKRFVYFIEDLIKTNIDDGLWEPVKENVMKECPTCKFLIKCPPTSDKNECMAVIYRH